MHNLILTRKEQIWNQNNYTNYGWIVGGYGAFNNPVVKNVILKITKSNRIKMIAVQYKINLIFNGIVSLL